MDAIAMIQRCHRHQYPEEYGGEPIREALCRERQTRSEQMEEAYNREGVVPEEPVLE